MCVCASQAAEDAEMFWHLLPNKELTERDWKVLSKTAEGVCLGLHHTDWMYSISLSVCVCVLISMEVNLMVIIVKKQGVCMCVLLVNGKAGCAYSWCRDFACVWEGDSGTVNASGRCWMTCIVRHDDIACAPSFWFSILSHALLLFFLPPRRRSLQSDSLLPLFISCSPRYFPPRICFPLHLDPFPWHQLLLPP